jgi:hypothetical protein
MHTTKLLPSRETTHLIRPDFRCNEIAKYYYTAPLVHLKSGLIRGVVSLEGSSLVVFCYLVASEIWPDKRGGLSRGEQFSSILLSLHVKSNYSPLERPPLLSGQISDATR